MRGLVLLSSLAALGCGTHPSVLDERLLECDLVSEGDPSAATASAFYQPTECYRTCLAEAECEELRGAMCGTSIEALQRCDARCAHRCGDGALIAVEALCDGFPQCADASDEEGCRTFRCGDLELVESARCNGRWECVDGADERGCTARSCTAIHGGTIYEWGFCDGTVECVDGADESGCGTFVCADGREIVHLEGRSPRCDGLVACSSGSDEAGCARLTPMCDPPS